MTNKEIIHPIEPGFSLTPEATPLSVAPDEIGREKSPIEKESFPIPKLEIELPKLKNRKNVDGVDSYLEQLKSGGVLEQMAGMVVFGSAVRCDISPRSDLDTLIVVKDLPNVVANKTEKEIDKIQRNRSPFPTAKSKTEQLIEWLMPRIGFYPHLRSTIQRTDFSEGKYQVLKTGDVLTKRLFPTKLTFVSIISDSIVLGKLEVPRLEMSKKSLITELIKSASVYYSLSLSALILSNLSSWGDIGSYEFSKLSLKNCFFALRSRNGTFEEIEKEFKHVLPDQFWEEFIKEQNSNWEEAGKSRLVFLAPKAIIRIHQYTISAILSSR